MVVGKLRLAATAPKAVITAATWMSLWVSTPRMTSSVVLWSGWAGCGMLGTVVWLLTARPSPGRAGGQDCDGALFAARPLSGHTRRSGGSTYRPGASGRQIKHKAPRPVITRVRPRPGTAPAYPHSHNG